MKYLILFLFILITCIIGYFTSTNSRIKSVNISSNNNRNQILKITEKQLNSTNNNVNESFKNNIPDKFYDTHDEHMGCENFVDGVRTTTFPVESETSSGYMNVTGVINNFNPSLTK